MTTDNNELFELDEQLKKLQERRQAIIAEKKQGVIDDVKGKIKQYDITLKELGYADSPNTSTEEKIKPKKGKGKLPPKYQNIEGDKQWSGHGRKPDWLIAAIADGCTLDDFLIAKPEVAE